MACQTEDSYYDGLLQCEVASCKSLVPIFAQWNDAITGKERNANLEQMIWSEEIKCYEGHPIRNPATFEGGPHGRHQS